MLEPRECLKHVLRAVERHAPLTHCMTNQVAAPLTANAILACGASPVMVLEKSECRDIARVADGLLVNIGTFTARQGEAMTAAIDGMRARARPWVLDPVAYGLLSTRSEWVQQMMAMHPPTLVRGNASEVIALSGGRPGRGTDSLDAPRDALPGAQALLAQGVEVVAISGAQDLVVSREGIMVIAHGHPWLTRVSGAGCALGGIMAAFAGAEGVTAQQAAVAATLVVTLAAEQAVGASTGIGGFVAAWLDALSHVSQSAHVPETLKAWQEEP